MSESRSWGIWIWIAAICAYPLILGFATFAFRARWFPPDRSGWSQLPLGITLLAHYGISLVLAIAPPRAARDGWYWPFLGIVLAVAWLTLNLAMGLVMATYYE